MAPSKRQTTMAKLQREQALVEKRRRKEERRNDRRQAAADQAMAAEQAFEPAHEELAVE